MKDLPLPEGWVYAGKLLDDDVVITAFVPTTAEGRHEALLSQPTGEAISRVFAPALLHSAPSIHIELTPALDCCALCCIHDEAHEMFPGLEHGEC